jgi:hypothetical protein
VLPVCSNSIKTEEYPSADVALNLLLIEYNYEGERLNNIDSKSGILLAVVAMLLPICATQSISRWTSNVFSIIFLALSILSFAICLGFLVAAVFPYKYDRFETYTLKYDKLLLSERTNASRWLSIIIADKIKHNRNQNSKKMAHYRNGAVLLVIATILFCLSIALGITFDGKEVNHMNSPDNTTSPQSSSEPAKVTGFTTDQEAITFLNVPCLEMCTAQDKREVFPTQDAGSNPEE